MESKSTESKTQRFKDEILEKIEKNELQPEGLLEAVSRFARKPESWIKQQENTSTIRTTNQIFWHAVETFLIDHYYLKTVADPEYRMPFKQLEKAVALLHSNTLHTSKQNGCFVLSKGFYQLLERQLIRTASSPDLGEISTFVIMLNQLTRSLRFQQQQSEDIKDICCNLLVEKYSELSHSEFAMICRTLSALSIKPGSMQHKNIVGAMKEYLQDEIQNIDSKIIYSIAKTIRLGNKRLGGTTFSTTPIDMLISNRILSDKSQILEHILVSSGNGNPQISEEEISVLDQYFEAVRAMRTRPGVFDKTTKAELVEMIYQALFAIRNSLPIKSLTRDLRLLAAGEVTNQDYRTYLHEYIGQNKALLPHEHFMLLPQLAEQLQSDPAIKEAKLGENIEENKNGENGGEAPTSHQDISDLLQKISQSRSMYNLNLVLNNVKRLGADQNDQIWEHIYQKALSISASDGPFQREPFENIVSELSSKAAKDPQVLDKVGSLLQIAPTIGVSIETILKLRNDAVLYNEHQNDVQSALEMRAIGLLAKFGSARGDQIHLFKSSQVQEAQKHNTGASQGKQIMRKVIKKVITKR